MIWNILIVLSLILNIYCIINIFMAADAAKTQLNINKLLSDHICKLNTAVDVLRKEIEELKQTMPGGDNSDS